jgi:hypothetical protein
MSDHEFNTPAYLLDLFRKLDPKRGIGLDPCANRWGKVHAHEEYTRLTNGLSHSWRGHGLVFMNPPHSMSPNNIEPWMAYAWEQFIELPAGNGDQFVGLVPAKTDTEWFHAHGRAFIGKCFLRGRLKFELHGKPTPGNGKFASLVLYEGEKLGLFQELMEPLGWLA